MMRFIKNRQGVALIEFVILFPFMFLLVFAAIEIIRYALIIHRVEKAAYTLADITVRYHPATASPPPGEVTITVDRVRQEVLPQFHRIMGVFGNPAREAVVVSSVIKRNGQIFLRWQQTDSGMPVNSVVTGNAPQNTSGDNCYPTGFTGDAAGLVQGMLAGENMIVAEVYYDYHPVVEALLPVTSEQDVSERIGGSFALTPRRLSRTVYIHPRNVHLMDLPPVHPVLPNPCGN